MRRERRELSLELGDARGQRVALGLERLAVARAHHHNLRLSRATASTSIAAEAMSFVGARVFGGERGRERSNRLARVHGESRLQGAASKCLASSL